MFPFMWEGYGLKIYLKTFFFQHKYACYIYNNSGSSYLETIYFYTGKANKNINKNKNYYFNHLNLT